MANETMRIEPKVKKQLWHYKLDHRCRSFSIAIGHALNRIKELESQNEHAQGKDKPTHQE